MADFSTKPNHTIIEVGVTHLGPDGSPVSPPLSGTLKPTDDGRWSGIVTLDKTSSGSLPKFNLSGTFNEERKEAILTLSLDEVGSVDLIFGTDHFSIPVPSCYRGKLEETSAGAYYGTVNRSAPPSLGIPSGSKAEIDLVFVEVVEADGNGENREEEN